ncbi:MAG: nitroreductase family protein [Bifidobacteriaceae bacterium]|nr:nitroreductase family protein [Bifidobacteriaceae bacterium]
MPDISETLNPTHNTLIDAINVRTAVRQFTTDKIPEELERQLRSTLDAVNLLSGLSIQLVTNYPDPFAKPEAEGHFSNARNFFAVVGPKDDEEAAERAGFYLERIILTATLRGLSTVWVAGSWNKEAAAKRLRIRNSEELLVGALVGYSADHAESKTLSERIAETEKHRPSLGFDDVVTLTNDGEVPQWFRNGIAAVLKAPSAMNSQEIHFDFDPVTKQTIARIDSSRACNNPVMPRIDLGIAKLHFRLGAGGGTWTWGDGGRYSREEVAQP